MNKENCALKLVDEIILLSDVPGSNFDLLFHPQFLQLRHFENVNTSFLCVQSIVHSEFVLFVRDVSGISNSRLLASVFLVVRLRSGEIFFLVVVLFRILQLYHTSKYRVIRPTKYWKCCLLWSKTTSICIVWPASLIGVSTERNSCSEGSRIHFMIKHTVKAPEWFWLCRPWPSLDVSLPAGCVSLRGWMLRAVDLLGIPCCYWSILQEAINQLATSLHLYLDSYECAEWQCKFAIGDSGTVILTVSGLRKLCCCRIQGQYWRITQTT